MQRIAHTITIDDPLSLPQTEHRSFSKRRHGSVRPADIEMSKERNLSAMLPRLEKGRYSVEHREVTELNVLNFVKTSRRQMNAAIGQQQSKA